MRRALIAFLILNAGCAVAPSPTALPSATLTNTPTEVTLDMTLRPSTAVGVTLAPTRPPTQPPTATSTHPTETSTPTAIQTETPTITRTPTAVIALPSQGSILREYWFNVEGYTPDELRADPDFPASPDYCDQASEIATTPDQGDSFGARLRGTITPPRSGEYTFWIGSDNGSEFWLSTDDTVANLRKLLDFDAYANYLDFDGFPQQASEPVRLVGETAYYFEALFQEDSSGFDWLAVAWQGPGITERQVVGAQYLAAGNFVCALNAPPTRTPQPTTTP